MIPLNRLVLGTVKFGLNFYGYGSQSRPTAAESVAILRRARRLGIERFDTAYGYGDAVALLQAAEIPREAIICKCRLPLVPSGESPATFLIHNPTLAEFDEVPYGCGVSVYTVEEVAEARRLGIAPIQAPGSCLNKDPGPVAYSRAPFLQGVLLRSVGQAPMALMDVVRSFWELARAHNVSPAALALHAAYSEWPDAPSAWIVFGVSSVRQLEENVEAAGHAVPDAAIFSARALGAFVNVNAVLPSLWSVPRA